MRIQVYGCHGGDTPRHRTSSFLIDGKLAIDCGAAASSLTLREQNKVEAVLVSHAHLDHVRDLATLADNRCQAGPFPLVIAGTPWTLGALKTHFFNNVLWPDFSRIPLQAGNGPTIRFLPLRPERVTDVAGYNVRAILVNHTIESAAFVIERGGKAIAYSGDTGPTDRLWQVLGRTDSLRAILAEVSFPNELSGLAKASGHHTPETLAADLVKFRALHPERHVPIHLYHIKPVFEREVHKQLARLRDDDLSVMHIGDRLVV